MGLGDIRIFKGDPCECGSIQYKMVDFIKTGICTGIPVYECVKCGELKSYGDRDD